MTTYRLTKSRFMNGLACERRLWLQVHQPGAARPLSMVERHRMEIGTAFGRDVTRLFPGGVKIEAGPEDPTGALEETEQQLRSGAPALFEAAFLFNETFIRADVLVRSARHADRWQLIEVKSQSNSAGRRSARKTKLKKHHSDMALQLYVLAGAGLSIEQVSLAWVNTLYERRGEVDWAQLVAIEDQTGAVRERLQDIATEVERSLALLDRPEMPEALFAKSRCNGCAYSQLCWGDEPEDSIIQLPRITTAQRDQLRSLGVTRIPEIPSTFDLKPSQAIVRDAFDHPEGRVVEREALRHWLRQLVYPLHYLDFESWNPCVPPFDHLRPYAQIPFQYSLHIQHEPGAEPTHHDFLAEPGDDPRPGLIEHLVADIEDEGSLVAHHARFERERIVELAKFSRPHQGPLHAMSTRFVDTETPFKKHWYAHPALFGRSSIKLVLPVMAPDIDYGDLEIADGSMASIQYEKLTRGLFSDDEAEAVRHDLLEYCQRDTLAMVKVVDRLRELAT